MTDTNKWMRVTNDPATLPEPGQFVLGYGLMPHVLMYAPDTAAGTPWVQWDNGYARIHGIRFWQKLPPSPIHPEYDR
jgi:hypothetical protein